jgi:hypothetical protein
VSAKMITIMAIVEAAEIFAFIHDVRFRFPKDWCSNKPGSRQEVSDSRRGGMERGWIPATASGGIGLDFFQKAARI